MAKTIVTKHPGKGRVGKEISKEKYDIIRAAITETLTLRGPLSEKALITEVEVRLQKTPFPGSVAWYVHTVRLDLEARKVIRKLREGDKERFEIWPDLVIP